jgi:hypothetical protein
MSIRKILIIILSISLNSSIYGQPWFPSNGEVFNTAILPRIDIKIDKDSLEWLYQNVSSDKEFEAQFVFPGGTDIDTLENIGFGLRGNTSRVSAKKSFKVSFNAFEKGRKYKGLEKMNLNGEHNDPSVIRSHLVWNFFIQMQVPGARSNHVDVYINNRFYGVYINVEHIDEEFVESRYGNNLGNLYKCLSPADLTYLGSDKDAYKNNGYELKTNTDADDFSDLINFTDVLQNTSSADMPVTIEPIFNMNAYLRYLAVEIFTGHWDGYSGNRNNYYLYNNAYTGKFEFIPYDVDNTFGIDWFGIDWASRDIYHWWNGDWYDLPLTEKAFGNQVYVDRYSYFLNELISNYADTTLYFPKIDALHDKISLSAEADPYRPLDYGWSFNDFSASYTKALGTHVKYGLKEYISVRIKTIQQQLVLNAIAPIIENVYHNFPAIAESIAIKANITDDEPNSTATLNFKINDEDWQTVTMTNRGNRLFNAVLPAFNESGKVLYFIEAEDESGNITREPFIGEYTINIGRSNVNLHINEFMASNQNTIMDNYGETEDWIEIYNAGAESVNLMGKYLSDDLSNKTKWKLPNVILQPGDYYIVWADNDTNQGENHANFKLSQSGEAIGIFDSFEHNYAPLDTINYGEQTPDVSFGKQMDGMWQQQQFITPLGENGNTDLAYINFTYNMNKQIIKGNFILDVDFIDIAGTFNDWQGSVKIYDGDADGLHAATLFGFAKGNEIQYKARMLADWSGGEFLDMGDTGNRRQTLLAGKNEVSHWFNDEPLGTHNALAISTVTIFPNPVRGSVFNIVSNNAIKSVEIYNSSGLLVNSIAGYLGNNIAISHQLKNGIYFITINTNVEQSHAKIVIY